jgi:prepilin-type N-terminal cleavage/methylation domain-containing protein
MAQLLSRPSIRKGFTLIELLVVIAIILILIALALPNFLEAQIRARVVRAEADMRTVATAVESYYGDRGAFPYVSVASLDYTHLSDGFRWLTSPVAYLTSLPLDPFSLPIEPPVIIVTTGPNYKFVSTTPIPMPGLVRFSKVEAYAIYSFGPNLEPDSSALYGGSWPFGIGHPCPSDFNTIWTFSPTNGSRSVGDLVRLGGEYRAGFWCLDGVVILGRDSNVNRPWGGPGES